MTLLKRLSTLLIFGVLAFVLFACNEKDYIPTSPFITKGQTVNSEKELSKGTPHKKGFVLKGWYTSKRGRNWLNPEPVKFPFTAQQDTYLYPYFEPKNSKAVSYTKEQTYKLAFTEQKTDPVLNPFDSQYAHETDLQDLMSTPLYEYDINWEDAIHKGLAASKGDLSKINKDNISGLQQEIVPAGANGFPEILEGKDQGKSAVIDNHYDEVEAGKLTGTKFRFTMRDDMTWEDGSKVTAHDYLFALLQLLDGKLSYFRSPNWVTTANRRSGSFILNARRYYMQGHEIGTDKNGRDKNDYAFYNFTVKYTDSEGQEQSNTFKFTKDEYEAIKASLPEHELNKPFNLAASNQWVNPKTAELAIIKSLAKALKVEVAELAKQIKNATLAENPFYIGEKGTKAPAVDASELGFKAVSDTQFEVTFEKDTQLSNAIAKFMNMKLVHKQAYEKSKSNDGKYQYGTPKFLPLSYGPYVLKTWDSGQKMVFNKNYNSFQSLKHNYKAISYEFMKNIDQKMQAFKRGEIDATGLTQDYLGEYSEHKSLRKTLIGYPQNIVLNPVTYEGRANGTTEMIRDVNFRQALFYGMNRKDFNSKINIPNVTSLFTFPNNATQYDNDPEWYLNTKETKKMLKEMGLNEDGYDVEKAKALFNKAYEAWTKKGFSGPVNIRYIGGDGKQNEKIMKYISEQYTDLFGADKIKFNLQQYDDKQLSEQMNDRKFDLAINAVGFGSATNTSVYAGLFSLFFERAQGKSQFGFSNIFDFGVEESEFDIKEADKLDLRKTWEYLKKQTFDEKTDNGFLKKVFDVLQANNGYFVGNGLLLFDYGLYCNFIWAGNNPQYDGDIDDRNTVTRYFHKKAIELCGVIPIASRASTSVYSSAFHSEWPAFHNIMKWGFARFNYLTSDPDFKPAK